MSYALAGKEIIHELLHDEVIIANLELGMYYSIRGCGIVIWPLLVAGYPIPAIESLLSQKYGDTPSIAPFVQSLLEEKLLVRVDRPPSEMPTLPWSEVYEPPLFERFDEMKNLLKLDPIHEVDEQGWPSQK